jgi:hypothetical protein
VDHHDLLPVLDDQVRGQEGVARTEAFVSLDLRFKRLSALPDQPTAETPTG